MTNDATPAPPRRQRRVRWWPVLWILALAGARWVHIWYFKDYQRQYQVMESAKVVLAVTGLLLVWMFFFSRLRWRARFAILGAFLAGLVLAGVVFRFEGVTGDLVPILEPRWRPRAAAATPLSVKPASERAIPPAADRAFPQFLGPTRDGVITGVRLARDWAAYPPECLWRQPVGQGWGGVAIVEGMALTQEQVGPEEFVTCYDLGTGRRLWAHGYAARYDSPIGGVGPRTTPTVVGRRVFAVGATGVLTCLDLDSGHLLWSTNVVGEVPAAELEWGLSSSPLVFSNLVVVAPRGVSGRSLVAYHADDGAFVWAGGSAKPSYSSPRLESPLGQPQILTFTEAAVAAHDPASGALLWDYPWRGGHPHVTDSRLISTNLVLISSGYGTGSQLVELQRSAEGIWSATNQVWRSIRLKSKFANILLRDGFAYGLDDGRLVCLDLADGERRWQGDRFGHGQLLLVGDLILITAENGDVALVEANPEAFSESARFHALDGKTWNPPALAGDILLVRNDREAAAYRLPTEDQR